MKTTAPQKTSSTPSWLETTPGCGMVFEADDVVDIDGIQWRTRQELQLETLQLECQHHWSLCLLQTISMFSFLRDFTDLSWNTKWLLQARKHSMWMEVVEGRKRTMLCSQRSCALDFEQNAVKVPAQLRCCLCYWIPSSCSRFSGAPTSLSLHHLLTKIGLVI